MRVCVTGGTGFIGGALVRRLLAEGHEVCVLARPSPRADALEAQGASVVRGELADSAAIENAVKETDLVFHAAARVTRGGPREQFVEANVKGTERLLEACLRLGTRRIVHLSSIAVYGSAKEGEIIDEAAPFDEKLEGRDFYSQSKIAADALAASFAQKNKSPTVILRPGIVYGPGKPLPVALLGFRMGRINIVFGTPHQWFPLNYVENLVDALLLCMKPSSDTLRQYIILDDDDLSLGKYHRIKSDADHTHSIFLPGWPVLAGGPLGGVPRRQAQRALQNRHYSSSRIRQELGWSPRIGLKEAIGQTLKRSG
jgi:nucleoside-diphosphate-sugar epimerase